MCCHNPVMKNSGCDRTCDTCGTTFVCTGVVWPGRKAPLIEDFNEKYKGRVHDIQGVTTVYGIGDPVFGGMTNPTWGIADYIPLNKTVEIIDHDNSWVNIDELPDDLRKQVQEWMKNER